jgi:hypothetical protein
MPVRIRNYMKFFVAAFLLVSFCFVEADAQTKKKRTRRTSSKPAAPKPVITNPPIAPATDSTGDVKIISTADPFADPTQSPDPSASPSPAKKADATNQEDMQKTINNLSNQVDRLNNKLSDMNEDDRYHLDMERLTRAEQRAEQLRSQLLDTESKIADIEAKLEQIEYAIKPENIERSMQGFGSVRPEEARETRRRQLESERTRLRAQYKILETSRTRLTTASTSADNEVDMLRTKLEQRRQQMDAQSPANEKRTRKP